MNTAGEEICWIVRLMKRISPNSWSNSIDGGGLKFDLFLQRITNINGVFSLLPKIRTGDSYYGTNQDPNAYGKTTDLTVMAGTQYAYSFDKFFVYAIGFDCRFGV